MPWLIGLNVLLYAASLYLYLNVLDIIWAVICFCAAGLLSLVLSGGAVNLFDDLF